MNDACRRFDALIARSSQLTTEETVELDRHLAGCASCRDLARAMKPVESLAFAATGVTATLTDDAQGGAATARGDLPLSEAGTDRYRITGEVGRGGIGRVLRALDQVLDRQVAVKELFSSSEGTRKRFVREALITARLQHPSIVPVYDAGHLGDRSPFYAMKLVAGRPLDEAIAGATTLSKRLALLPSVLAVADAMAYAHNERVIHRDLKPTNVLVGRYGETIVIDWGLAKELAVDDTDALDAGPYRAAGLDHTMDGAVLGTPAYMAPEQAAGEPVDERADVYALGAILYQVISGVIPHEGATLEDMVQRVVSGRIRPLTEREPDVPRDLAAIVSKAMALEPSARYANAQGLADDLRRFQNGQLVASHRYGTRELLRRWVRRHRAAVMVALAAVVLVGIVGIASVLRIVRARHDADEAAAVATKERNTATQTVTELLQEQGRQELVAGRPARAAVYLSEAYARSHDPDVALRSMLADAMRSIEAQRWSLDGNPAPVGTAAFSRDGTRIVTSSYLSTEIWDAATGKRVRKLDATETASAALSPDGSRIVTAGDDHKGRLWDARTGRLLATFDHADKLQSATFSPDGARIVTTGDNGIAKLWDATTMQLVGSLEGHRGTVTSAAFDAEGARLVTASSDQTAKVWDVKTAKLLFSLEHDTGVWMARFSPDGAQIVTVGGATARLWDARTGQLEGVLEGQTGLPEGTAYSRDGSRIVVACYDHTVKLFDSRTRALLTTLHGHSAPIRSAAFSPDGSSVLTASDDHTAKLWDAHTGGLLASFEGHRASVESATFSPDGTQVLTAGDDGSAKVWDATPSKLRLSFDAGAGHPCVGLLSRDGATIVTVAQDPIARVWDARRGTLIASLEGHRGHITFFDLDDSATHVVTASSDTTAKLWEARTGKLLVSLDHPGAVQKARVSPDATRIVTVATDGARLWDATTGKLIAKLDGDTTASTDTRSEVSSIAFSADSRRVVTGSSDGTARIWTTDNGTLVAELEDVHGVNSVEFSHDGERVVTGNNFRSARIWDARTGKLLRSLDGHTAKIVWASFSPDGARVVTASRDRTAKLWDARTGTLLASLDAHTGEIFTARFSPDGARVVTASADDTAKVWDGQTGALLASLDGHGDFVTNAMFNPDATRVMTTSADGTVKLWDVQLEKRTPDAIGQIIRERDPWTLSNGVLVPVPIKPRAGRTIPDNGSAAAPAPGGVTSNDDYATQLRAMYKAVSDLFEETDCDRLAAKLRAFADANRARMAALTGWGNTHAIDEVTRVEVVTGRKKLLNPRVKQVYKACVQNKAVADAFGAAVIDLPQ